jgi:hypothetical protein
LEQLRELLPIRRHFGGLRADTVGVVAEGVVKHRQLTDRAIDQVGALRMKRWIEVNFVGKQQFCRGVRVRQKDGLTADHDE